MGDLKLSDNVLSKRVFKQQILDLHLKDFMIGQTTPYLNKFKNVKFPEKHILAPELEFLKLVPKACFENYAYIISLLNLQLCLKLGSAILTFRDGAG